MTFFKSLWTMIMNAFVNSQIISSYKEIFYIFLNGQRKHYLSQKKKVSYQVIKWKLNQLSRHVLRCLCHLVILVDNQFQIHHTFPLLPKKTCTLLKMIDFTYFHLIMKYGIILWSSSTDSKWVFQQHSRIVRLWKGQCTQVHANLHLKH